MSESACQYVHGATGRYCPPCQTVRRAAQRQDDGRHDRLRDKPQAYDADDQWREDAECRPPVDGLDAEAWFAVDKSLVQRAAMEEPRSCAPGAPCRRSAWRTRSTLSNRGASGGGQTH